MRVAAVVHVAASHLSRPPSVRGARPLVANTPERANQEGDVIAQARRAGRVLDTARPRGLAHRSAVAVEQPLEHAQPDLRRVPQVDLGDELGRRSGPGQPEFAQHNRHRVRDDHTATHPVVVSQHVVHGRLPLEGDAVEPLLQRICKLRIRRRERWRRARREAPVAEQQAQRIRVERDVSRRKLDRRAEHRELEPMLMAMAQPSDHCVGTQRAARAAPPVLRRAHSPQVLRTAQRRRPVLCLNAVHIAPTLREYAQNRCGSPV